MFPYLDFDGFVRRSIMPRDDARNLETREPGWIEQTIGSWSSWIDARLRKRYGNAENFGNSLPLGQQAPALVAAGTSPPNVTLTGRPTLGSVQIVIAISTGGALGAALFQWSKDAGRTWVATGTATAASVVLGDTGLTAVFPTGAYATDNVYAAATPVPEAVLGWLTVLTTWDAYEKRGRDPQDPLMVSLKDRRDQVLADVKEAADSKDGLFDLPESEDKDSAITTGGPFGYSEAGPYDWTDRQAEAFRGGR